MTVMQSTAAETLSMLEERLQRISFLLHGDSQTAAVEHDKTSRPSTVSTRLANLERSLNSLVNRSNAAYDVLLLQQQIPDLFHPSAQGDLPSSTLNPAALAQLILAHDALFKTTSSQLQSLSEISSIPDSASFTNLIASQARIEKIEAKQIAQAREVAELREKSAEVVEAWYEDGVLEMGERWADWEERLRDCEILVRRQEAAKRRDESAV